MGSVAGALSHAHRERPTANADIELLPTNEQLCGSDSVQSSMGALRERLPPKRRKDAVLAVEYLLTASPEWFETATKKEQDDFFEKAQEWVTGKYGADNVIAAVIHRDETTPHLSMFVVPLTSDGRLTAKEFIGDRAKMSQDQTDFAHAVQHLNLNRGVKGSKASHQTIRTYYSKLNSAAKALQTGLFRPDDFRKKWVDSGSKIQRFFGIKDIETAVGVRARLNEQIERLAAPLALKASERDGYKKLAERCAQGEAHAKQSLKKAMIPFEGLTQSQIKEVVRLSEALKKEKGAEQEKARGAKPKRR